MARGEDDGIWLSGSEDPRDAKGMTEREREAYLYAEEAGLTRASLLKMAGLGLGAVLAGPLAGANAARPSAFLQSGSKLIIGRGTTSQSLDPHKSTGFTDAEVNQQIFDSLVFLGENGKIFPGLATAWQFNGPATQITLKLRQGIKFHDGTPFDANAVKFSLDRWKDPKTGSFFASSLGPLKGVTVVNQYTVALHYPRPFAPALANLATSYGAGGIVSPAGVAKLGDKFGRNPIGTGPYQFVSWDADDTITLKRNPNHGWATPYYKGPNGKPLNRGPVIETIEVRVIPSDTTRVSALRAKEIDLIAGLGAVPTAQVASLQKSKGYQVVKVFRDGGPVMILNAGRAPLIDARSRLAITHAINGEELVKLAINGQGRPATSIVPVTTPGHDPSVAKYYTYDPDLSKSLLKQTGQSSGFSIDYQLPTQYVVDADKRAAQVIQQNLAKVGIKLNIQLVATPVFFDHLLTLPLAKKAHAMWNSYSAPDADNLVQLFHSGNGFWAHYPKDNVLDSLLDRQSTLINKKERFKVLSALQRRMATKMYTIPLYEQLGLCVASTAVHNIHLDSNGNPHYQELSRS